MNSLLVCPKCKGNLIKQDNSLKCTLGHSYDIAKQGYVNLLLGNAANTGDDKDMCRSRHNFHSMNYYKCLAERLADICLSLGLERIIDAGCGEGYYIRAIRDMYFGKGKNIVSLCGIDLAKEAILIGAKCEKVIPEDSRIEYAVAGIFDMPVADNSTDCVLSVFAPVPDAEAHRVLTDGGYMIVVTPGEKHLDGLKRVIYDSVYYNEVSEKTYDGFATISVHTAEDVITVEGDNIKNLFHMTPYYWKTSESDAKKLDNLTELTTKIEFIITIYKKI